MRRWRLTAGVVAGALLATGCAPFGAVAAMHAVVHAATLDATASASAQRPVPPTHVSATAGVKSVRLRWAAPSSDNGSPITGYVITRYYHGRAQASKTIKSAAVAAVLAGLPLGDPFVYRVAAKNRFGVSPQSTPSNVVTATGKLGPNAPPPAGGYFQTLPPGAKLPTGTACAAKAHYSAWEPRADNNAANHRTPPWPVKERNHPDFNSTFNEKFKPRINGDFTGTTDEIIQWAACKWGLSDELVRAEAVDETEWHQDNESDDENRSSGHCALGDNRDPCPTSFGILQIKWYYNPDSTRANSSYPWSRTMTAFSLDYALAWMRGCYEGWAYFGNQARGDLLGCMGGWYSGSFGDSGAQDYIARVQGFENSKPWRHW